MLIFYVLLALIVGGVRREEGGGLQKGGVGIAEGRIGKDREDRK